MSMLIDRDVAGSKTHAFVIGVGNFPHAHAGQGVLPALRGVPDLPSAADSAKLMCDWLLENKDRLAAPLATLEVLISDPSNTDDRYPWPRGPVDPATEANVAARGLAWFARATAAPGDVAFFYCCGHGASYVEQPVLFLEDLNANPVNPWSHINLSHLATALRKDKSLKAAFLFSDACGEFVPSFALERAQDCRFYAAPDLFAPSRNNVSLLCAAPEGLLAYEGADAANSKRRFGRFTQACLKGLNGSSARWSNKRWAVNCRDLAGDLKSLRRVFFDYWGDAEPFDPYSAVTPIDALPIVYPHDFELPVVVMTDPLERMPDYGFVISERSDPNPPWLKNRAAGEPGAWYTTVPPSCDAMYAIAVQGANNYPLLFQPKEPLFDQWVPVP
jgi:hypothetical protein